MTTTNLSPFSSLLLVLLFISLAGRGQNELFNKRVVASGFNSAWEVVCGPNDSLWITENKDYKIQRVDVSSGAKTLLANIKTSDVTIDLPPAGPQAQGGLMGMALHPNLYSPDPTVRAAKPWVYVVYVYKRGSCPGTNTSCVFTTKVVRFIYSGNALIDPLIIVDNIPGSSDHNSGRLVIGPVIEPGADASHTQYRLYYTCGDQGAGRAYNSTRTQNSLNKNSFEGKVIRLNTEDDGDGGEDAWVPNDNPFYNNAAITPQDYVYSYGHRNPQGLVWGTIGASHLLFSSEQMDKTDDEVNLISAGKNYGWDSVAGRCDNNVNGNQIGQTVNPNEQLYCSAHPEHTEPLFTLFTATAAEVAALPADNALWPTVAPSSIDFYGRGKIPDWNYSLLISPLKKNFIYRLKLNASGTAITGDTISYFRGDGDRIRRITAAPDGTTFYVARDVGASANGGNIMEYKYSGAVLALHDHPGVGRPPDVDRITIFPNPVKDMIKMDVPKSIHKPFFVRVFDLAGILRLQQSVNSYNFFIHAGNLADGVYIIKLYNGNSLLLKVQKFIKQ